MEHLRIAPADSAERAFANFQSYPRFGGFSQPKGKYDDEKMFTHFKFRMGVAANIRGKRTNLFCFEDHKRVYSKLLK